MRAGSIGLLGWLRPNDKRGNMDFAAIVARVRQFVSLQCLRSVGAWIRSIFIEGEIHFEKSSHPNALLLFLGKAPASDLCRCN